MQSLQQIWMLSAALHDTALQATISKKSSHWKQDVRVTDALGVNASSSNQQGERGLK